jgi:hypothetical protein
MNLSDDDGDALASALLNESEKTTPCIVYQRKKACAKRKKGRCLILFAKRRKVCVKRK